VTSGSSLSRLSRRVPRPADRSDGVAEVVSSRGATCFAGPSGAEPGAACGFAPGLGSGLSGNPVGSPSGTCLRSAFVIHQDPLAYLLGLEGIARGGASRTASSTSGSWTGCRCRIIRWMSSSTRSPSCTFPGFSRYWPSSPGCCAPAGPGHLRHALRASHPRLGDHSARPGGRTMHHVNLPASARRLPAGGTEPWPSGTGCEEPGGRQPGEQPDEPLPEPVTGIGDWQDWPWSLMDYLPSVARASRGRRPAPVIWHFQRPAG
jgi:hypothetical protein